MADTAAPTLLVTGATGLVGSNVCVLAHERGHAVRALVRGGEAPGLEQLGVEVAAGDVTDPASLRRAAAGVEWVVHAAALLGGTWAEGSDAAFEAVNAEGTRNVLAAAGDARTVCVTSIACLQAPGVTVTERSPVPEPLEGESAYTHSKRRGLAHAIERAGQGQDVVIVAPGGIYGPGPVAARALAATSFNAALLKAARGTLPRYPRVRLPWAPASDVAAVALLALERGRAGGRYLAMGRVQDTCSVAAFLSAGCEAAGVAQRVEDIQPSDDPELEREFGSMARIAGRRFPDRLFENSETIAQLGYAPTPLADGLQATVRWLRELGEL